MAKKREKSNTPVIGTEVFNKPQRLQRVLAAAGFGSRRECEEFIVDGRVEVDGKVAKTLGVKVDTSKQKVHFDGQRVSEPRLQYFMLHKPPGVLSTARDPAGRLRVVDLIKTDTRVYNVGRLDKSSEGLILVTNDGDLANQLTHPRYGIEKTYRVLVAGNPSREQLEILTKGVYLAEAFVQAASVKVKKRSHEGCWLEIVLDEGRNREIRRLLARIGHKVIRLVRIAIGPLNIGELPLGAHRRLTYEEIDVLKRAAESRHRRKGRSGGKRSFKSGNKGKALSFEDARRETEGRSSKKTSKKKSRFSADSRKSAKKKSSKRGAKPVSEGRAKARAKPVERKKKQYKKKRRR